MTRDTSIPDFYSNHARVIERMASRSGKMGEAIREIFSKELIRGDDHGIES